MLRPQLVAFGPGIDRMGFGEHCWLFPHLALILCRRDKRRCLGLREGDWKETSVRAEIMASGCLRNAERWPRHRGMRCDIAALVGIFRLLGGQTRNLTEYIHIYGWNNSRGGALLKHKDSLRYEVRNIFLHT